MRAVIFSYCLAAYAFLLPFALICVAVAICIILPLACFRKTRDWAGIGLLIASYIFGLTTWLLGAAVTFSGWGWVGLIIGLLIVGIGVVPMGILAAFFTLDLAGLGWSLLLMLVVAMGSRLGAVALRSNGDR